MKDLIIKCNCVGKCGLIRVIDYKDKNCEIQFTKGEIYLEEKDIKKLVKYLNKIIIKIYEKM